MNDSNGNGDGTVYVPFGPKETQVMPIEWATEMLTMWRERKQVEFGRMLAEVVTGVPSRGR